MQVPGKGFLKEAVKLAGTKSCPVLLPLRAAAKPDAISGFAGQIGFRECARQCAVMVRSPMRAQNGSAERSTTPSRARYGAQPRGQGRALRFL
jgi:hypothetical protein